MFINMRPSTQINNNKFCFFDDDDKNKKSE